MKNPRKKPRGFRNVTRKPNTESLTQRNQMGGRPKASGLFESGFPTQDVRKATINRVRHISEADRSPDDWYALGSMLLCDGSLENDENLLNEGNDAVMRAADADPPVADAVLDMVWLLNLRGLPTMARKYACLATELCPDQRNAWRFRANTHLQLRQREEAIACLKKAAAVSDSTEADKQYLAKVEQSLDAASGKGILLFGPPEEFEPDDPIERKHESTKLHLFYTRQALALEPDSPELLMMAAIGSYHLQRFTDAVRYLVQLGALQPECAEALTLRALIEQKKGDVEAASNFYRKALDADSHHPRANINLAKLLLDEGNAHEARPLLTVALEIEPSSAEALELYGNTVGIIEKDYLKEADYHSRSIEIGPASPLMRYNLCLALLQAGEHWRLQKEWRKHQTFLERVPADLISAARIRLLKGVIQVVLNPPTDFHECVQAAQEIQEHFGGKAAEPLLNRGWELRATIKNREPGFEAESLEGFALTASQCGLYESSLRAYRELERIVGSDREALLGLVYALERLDRREEALEVLSTIPTAAPGATTMKAILLRDLGRHEEALQAFFKAVENDRDMPEAHAQGILLAIQMGDMQALAKFEQVAAGHESANTKVQCALAKAKIALGYPKEAADFLRGLLYDNSIPRGFVAAANENGPIDPDGETETEAFLTLGIAFLKSRQLPKMLHLWNWIRNHRHFSGDWNVLVAEANRIEGYRDAARHEVEQMPTEPPPQATIALCCLADGDWDQAQVAVDQILAPIFEKSQFSHPQGHPTAIGHAVRSMKLLADGFAEEAESEARKALKNDTTCSLAHTALARALDQMGKSKEALAAAIEGLERIPGDAGLVEWVVLRLLEDRDLQQADLVLSRFRAQLESRGYHDVASWLGETISRSQLADQSRLNFATAEWSWAKKLHPDSQQWLDSAVNGHQLIEKFTLGVAFYYCKIVERELATRIVEPFLKSVSPIRPDDSERDLRDFVRCATQNHPPGLGGICFSLTAAARPGRHGETMLMRSWRKYLTSLPEPMKSGLRKRSFLDDLKMMADVRNRLAHLGNLNAAEFERVEKAIVQEGKPGPLIEALGIS